MNEEQMKALKEDTERVLVEMSKKGAPSGALAAIASTLMEKMHQTGLTPIEMGIVGHLVTEMSQQMCILEMYGVPEKGKLDLKELLEKTIIPSKKVDGAGTVMYQ